MTRKSAVPPAAPGFADILHPVTPAEFFAEYYDRKLLHVPGGAEKFATVMSWPVLADLLNKTAIWSSTSLQLALDTAIVPPGQYCRAARSRDGKDILQPDAERVMDLLRRGASLVANDIDTLTPELAGFAGALETALHGKAQANLYCSWKQHQAFGSHFDTHDVYAVHVAGEKLWRIYETRADNPIAHPAFKSFGQEWHDRNRGAVAREIPMRPGDLLYIPRGLYHDALATSDATVHIAFGVTHVIGMDAFDMLSTLAVGDPAFRRNMPRPEDGPAAAAAWLADLGDRLATLCRESRAIEAMQRHQAGFRYPRGGISLPVQAAGRRFRLIASSLSVEPRNGAAVLAGPKGAVPIPGGLAEPVAWIVGRREFDEAEFAAAFPAMDGAAREKLLRELAGMKVIAVQ